MSAVPVRPRLAVLPAPGPSHHVPAVATPTRIATQVGRLTMPRSDGPPLMPEEKVEALLRALADRLKVAREREDSGEGAVRYSWHGGKFRALRSNADDEL